MISRLVFWLSGVMKRVDSSSELLLRPVFLRFSSYLGGSVFFRLLCWYLGLFNRLKVGSFLFRGFLNPWKLLVFYALVYLCMAFVSPVPVLRSSFWLRGILVFVFGVGLIGLSAYFFSRKELKLGPGGGYGYGFLLLGALGLMVNYTWIGLPILSDSLRPYYHNAFWMVAFNLFFVGLALLSTKLKKLEQVIALLMVAFVFTFPSGFRTDLIVAMGSVLVGAWSAGVMDQKKIFGLALLVVPLTVVLKSILIGSLDVGYIMTSRAGFSFYTLGNIMENVGVWGIGHGKYYFNLVSQLGGASVVQLGSFAGEFTVNMPRFYTSTFVGPLWVDSGIIGVVLGCVLFGYLLGRAVSAKCPLGMSLYAILLSVAFIWMETGPVQIYFIGMCVLVALVMFGKEVKEV